jgi:transcriptional regulator with XRE-family HTH domain
MDETIMPAREKPKYLGRKLLGIRQRLGLSQSQMARLLGFTKSFARISEYESNTREPSLITLLAYARLGQTSIDYLANDQLKPTFDADNAKSQPKTVNHPLQ